MLHADSDQFSAWVAEICQPCFLFGCGRSFREICKSKSVWQSGFLSAGSYFHLCRHSVCVFFVVLERVLSDRVGGKKADSILQEEAGVGSCGRQSHEPVSV